MASQLDNKEASLFRQVVRNYEAKQYKKGLKACDQILRKNPNHGQTTAMKALIFNSQGRGDEAFALAKVALKSDMRSHVCWHVYGLLYRSVKNYEEAIKAYKMALRFEPESQQILRDLALLQVQMRDWAGYCESRTTMLVTRPQLRQNWTALAVAQHLAGRLDSAEDVLTRYEDTLKTPPPKTDVEHSEAVLYKNTIIAESGRIQQALDHLNAACKGNLDGLAVLELRAKYLSQLDKSIEARTAFSRLIARNHERKEYFEGLETASHIVNDVEKREQIYKDVAKKDPRADAARRLPLDFLEGKAFEEAADAYLQAKLKKGVTSTFVNVRALYADENKKSTLIRLINGYVAGKTTKLASDAQPQLTSSRSSASREETDERQMKQLRLSALYYLAQHYNSPGTLDLSLALEHIETAIQSQPSKMEYLMTKARILKHMGDFSEAAATMEKARLTDARDRYINTKTAKYQLRNDENEKGLQTMSLFTRKEAVGGPLGDLHDMQCIWFLTEDAESFLRQESLGLALKRFTSISKVYDLWEEDQFDFHTFSLRKGMIRSYVDLIRWEDILRSHPFYTRAAIGAATCYMKLHDEPALRSGTRSTMKDLTNGVHEMSLEEQKRAEKKARADQRKAEAKEAKEQEAKRIAKKPTPAGDDDTARKEDTDPQGKELLGTQKPLEEALKFLTPVLELSPDCLEAQQAGFEIYLRMKKLLPALRCLMQSRRLSNEDPQTHFQLCQFLKWWETESKTAPERIQKVIKEALALESEMSISELNDMFLKKHEYSAAHVQGVVNVGISVMGQKFEQRDQKLLLTALKLQDTTREEVEDGLSLLRRWRAKQEDVEAYREKAREKWPRAKAFAEAGV